MSSKISVIGTGKTGSKVVQLLGENLGYAFDENTPPTIDKLKESDVLIIFVPGIAVSDIFDMVLESGVPTAWGSTGFDWPQDLNAKVQEAKTKWVLANNFSLGMNIIRHTIKKMSEASEILNNPTFNIHEVHHIYKKDAPSGTAISWKEWLAKEVEVSSSREGDVNGYHELKIKTDREEITLSHDALDRSIFAEGAIWAAEQLVNNLKLTEGVHTFGELFDQAMEHTNE